MGSQEVNKRLTTILMADVVGYSRLMATDEMGTIVQLKANRKELIVPMELEYHGRTVKLMGDGALMEFSSVSNALNFAVDVQRSMIRRNQDVPDDQKICYRVGINIGEIITDGDDIFGTGINICARLESICEPNGIFLTEDAYRQVENSAHVGFKALGRKKLKNIPEPVSIYRVLFDQGKSTVVSTQPGRNKPRTMMLGGALLLIIVFFLTYAMLYPGSQPLTDSGTRVEAGNRMVITNSARRDQEKTSIAVLPFDNLSGDPEQEYFSEGVSDDIITDLSQLPDLTVIARSSSFTFKGTGATVQQIGQDLGVAYLLLGSIRKSANRIRINAQLVDAVTGHALWAERYDGELADVFALQDEITGKIVMALSIRLTEDEKRQIAGTKTGNFEAYDLFLKGRKSAIQSSKRSMEQAIEHYQQAIEFDPEFARAYGALAVELARGTLRGHIVETTETKVRAVQLAKKAATIDPDSPHVQWALGYTYMVNKQYELAISALEKAISLSPSYVDGYGLLALIYNNQGKAKQAIEFANKAIDLNPHFTWEFPYNLGRANWALGNYEQAVLQLEEALERNPNSMTPSLYLASCYIQLGRHEDAEWVVNILDVQHPEISLSRLRVVLPLIDPQLRDRLFSNLQTAGLRE